MFLKIFKSSNFWALLFGMVMMLIIFGDELSVPNIGNLDTIFGQQYWKFMDVLYPLASVAIFLLYGISKGRLKINPRTTWPFIIFIVAAIMIQLDDFFEVLHFSLKFSDTYWTTVRWLYFSLAMSTFIAFGCACEKTTNFEWVAYSRK